MGLIVKKLQKAYPEFFMDISLEVKKGELLTLLGPSGCGKTTTLNLIAGFLNPDTGQIILNGEDITNLPPHKRKIGIVFQDYALFPHMNVYKNIAFGLKMSGIDEKRIRKRVEELLRLTKLESYEKRSVTTLSGGEQQRVALARALAPNPELLLLDEPLSALDAKLRKELRGEVRRIIKEIDLTTIYVTHDQEEAMALSDRIAVMKDGKIEQTGTPFEIYNRPKTAFVAEFVGMSNQIKAIYRGKGDSRFLFTTPEGTFEVLITPPVEVKRATGKSSESLPEYSRGSENLFDSAINYREDLYNTIQKTYREKEVSLYFRPEICIISREKKANKNTLKGTVASCEYLGENTLIRIRTPHGEYQTIVQGYERCAVGRELQIYIPPEKIHIIGGK